MGKLLFWIVVIVAVMFAIRLLNHKKAQQRQDAAQPPESKADPSHIESMVRCEHCGVHLPRSEAVLLNERLWCSTEHAKLGPRQR